MSFALDQAGRTRALDLVADWLGCPPGELLLDRVPGGRSTPVFRIDRGPETFYLRLSESAAASLGPEARAHELMLGRGVRVPEVIGYEPFETLLQRSAMLTTAIPGAALELDGPDDPAAILFAAGADLARIHQLRVDGYGWIRRDGSRPNQLSAPVPIWEAFVADLTAGSLDRWFDGATRARIIRLARSPTPATEQQQAVLAHGDFDTSHIFSAAGRYTGIIDFGEMRGAEWSFDLGHLALHAPTALHDVLRGYGSITPLPDGAALQIAASALRIGWFRLTQSSAASNGPYAAALVQGMERIALDPESVLSG